MNKKIYSDISGREYTGIIKYGLMPIANNYKEQKSAYKYDCKIGVCNKDKIFKNLSNIDEKILFNNYYPYKSSISKNFSIYLKDTAIKLNKTYINKKKISDILIIEVGSSDGVFLDEFRKLGIPHVGIEPTLNNHRLALKRGVNSVNKFLNLNTSKHIIKKYGKSDLVFATNVIGHINNIKETFKSIKLLLKDDGLFIFENIYLGSLIKNNSFDQLYDEHVYTLSVTAVFNLCKIFNLNLFNIEKTKVQGGSMKYYISKNKKLKKNLLIKKYLKIEKTTLKFSTSNILNFYRRNEVFKEKLKMLINNLKRKKKKVVGIGASAKSTFLINFCNFDSSDISCIYDNSEDKIGKYLPGTDITLKNQNLFSRSKFDYVVVFAWNHFDEIYKKYSKFKNMKKVKWILPNKKIEIIN